MKSRTELWQCALYDLGARCSVSTSLLERDITTALKRVKHEGDAFWTITLPQFGKDFEKSLSMSLIHKDLFRGWSKKDADSIFGEDGFNEIRTFATETISGPPKFLGGFMDRVYGENGLLLDQPDVESVFAIRQLTLMFGKLKEQCSDKKISSAYRNYVEVDEEVHNHLGWLTSQFERGQFDELLAVHGERRVSLELNLVDPLRQVIRVMFGNALSIVDRRIHDYDVVPKHGPGSTAEGVLGNQKYYQTEWPERMETLFPFLEYAVPSRNPEFLRGVTFLGPEDERPAKLLAVPKTASTPRLIAKEPICMQYMQQAVSRLLMHYLERPSFGRSPNMGSHYVGFEDQTPNQDMARIGSEDGSLATLDLSEASDRVPNWLIEAVFEDWPWFSEAVQVTRSRRVDVPEHGIISVSKFASMGSALTFPIEAMIFAAIAVKTVVSGSVWDSEPVNLADLNQYRDTVRVYGDDIIVPVESAEAVSEGLETFGFKVNQSKSFWTGMFRESCGKEYFMGEDVSIVRFRTDVPSRLPLRTEDASPIASTVATRNQFYMIGLWRLAAALDDVLIKVLKGLYPYVGPESQVLGRLSVIPKMDFSDFGFDVNYFDMDEQAPLVKGWVLHPKLPINEAKDEAALLKCLLINGDANTQSDHLERSGRPRVVSIKHGRARPY